MNPTPFILTACALYGLLNVLIEQKLTNINPNGMYMISYFIMFVLSSLVYLSSSDPLFIESAKNRSGFIMLFSCTFFLGNLSLIKAYNLGADVFLVTVLMVMVPVFAGIWRLAFVRGLPDIYQMISFFFAGLAVLFSILSMKLAQNSNVLF